MVHKHIMKSEEQVTHKQIMKSERSKKEERKETLINFKNKYEDSTQNRVCYYAYKNDMFIFCVSLMQCSVVIDDSGESRAQGYCNL